MFSVLARYADGSMRWFFAMEMREATAEGL